MKRDAVIGKRTPKFPPPPLRGTARISPICDLDQLRAEEAAQELPLVGDLTEMLQGERYAYAIMRPERATLVVRRLKNTRWQVAILKAKGGATVNLETMRSVEQWLERVNAELPWAGTDYNIRI